MSTSLSDLAVVGSAFFSAEALGSPLGFQSFGGSENPINLPVSLISDLLGFLHIGGSEDQEKPYQTDHGLHWIYPTLGISQSLTPTQHSTVYPNVDAAVRAAQPPAVSRFRTNGGREAYGFVYPSSGGFMYTGPFDAPGRFGGKINNAPPGFVASYHTHSESGFLSPADEAFLNQTGKPIYILTVPPDNEPASNGGIFMYMPGKPTEPFTLP